MTTVLFVHGTSVRLEGYEATLGLIREHLPPALNRPVDIEGVLWGDRLGSNPASKSVPNHEASGGQNLTDEQAQKLTWQLLDSDPLSEIRLLVLNRSRRPTRRGEPSTPGDLIDDGLQAVGAKLLANHHQLLMQAGVHVEISGACKELATQAPYKRLLEVADHPVGMYLDAVAEAIVALAIADVSSTTPPPVLLDESLREELVAAVRGELGPREAAITDRIVKSIGGTASLAIDSAFYSASLVATPYVKWRRGRYSDDATPIAGDILVYQARGESIRQLIRTRIGEVTPPVVIVAHSLGGVACVDLMIEEDLRDRVKLLVTVGSQAPYFYEINALSALEFGEATKLPEHVPPWLNLFNRRDFLSYVGEGVFPGRVKDEPIKSIQPFPQAHSVYWKVPETYQHIAAWIGEHV